MIDYTLVLGSLALCLLWTAWREHTNNNRRDSKLLLACSVLTGLSGVGVTV